MQKKIKLCQHFANKIKKTNKNSRFNFNKRLNLTF